MRSLSFIIGYLEGVALASPERVKLSIEKAVEMLKEYQQSNEPILEKHFQDLVRRTEFEEQSG